MIRAEYSDKTIVTQILTRSFDTNKSVNFVVKQDKKRTERIRRLMEYSFDISNLYGDVFLSDDKKAVALIIWPDKKGETFRSILKDVNLTLNAIGISNAMNVLKREAKIKSNHPDPTEYLHLWFIGVAPEHQGNGHGSRLLQEIKDKYKSTKRLLYLETSTLKNLPWYERFGFEIFSTLEFGFTLYLLRQK